MQQTIEISEEQQAAAKRTKCPCLGSGSLVTFSNGKPI